jgi:hemolysin activation/secretion protein
MGAVLVAGAALLGVWLATGAALAQVPRTLPGAVEPGRDRPLPEPPPESNFDFSIETPRRSPVPRAVDELRFQLRDIKVTGATVFSPEDLRALYEPLIGTEVSLGDILNIADEIEAKYRARGYIITRAYVPPQRVGDGVFTINVVEGYVNGLAVEGGDAGVRDLITSYASPVLGSKPLQLQPMERGLLLSNDLPGVTASGLLRPSPDQPGASDLAINVTEQPITGGLNFDNRGSKFTGQWTIGGDVEWNSPLHDGDQLGLNVQSSPEPQQRIQGSARYQHPIGTDGLTGSGSITISRGAPAGIPGADLTTDSMAYGPRLSYPVIRSREQSFYLDGGFTVQDATVNVLDGQVFSHDKWRVADLAATYTQSGFWNGNSSATFDVAQGLTILGATGDGSPELSRPGAKTDFTKVTGNLRRIQVLTGPVTLALNAQGQYAFAPLVVGEQITFGGYQIGRGYDPSALSGDHGLGGSAELRYDAHFDEYFVPTAQPYLFFDSAKIWDRVANSGGGLAVASTGLGVRLTLPHNLTMGVEGARTLKAVPGSDSGHEATKVLFNAAARF